MKDLTVLREKFDNHEMILPEEFSDLLDRLEQAEQAVARVREIANEEIEDEWDGLRRYEDICRALGGDDDGRE